MKRALVCAGLLLVAACGPEPVGPDPVDIDSETSVPQLPSQATPGIALSWGMVDVDPSDPSWRTRELTITVTGVAEGQSAPVPLAGISILLSVDQGSAELSLSELTSDASGAGHTSVRYPINERQMVRARIPGNSTWVVTSSFATCTAGQREACEASISGG